MATQRNILIAAACMAALTATAQQPEVKSTWNARKVVLPDAQYTSDQAWQAQVMVFNDGRRYQDADYNHVWGTPPQDAQGRQWYEAAYELTDGPRSWSLQQAPFSSDEVYMGQRSYRWITSDITGDIYLRRTFTLDEPVAADLFLACGHDDAPAEYYINGQLVVAVSDGWNNDERRLLTPEQKALIRFDGTENVLAVHVHQNWGGAYADCGLYEADMALTTTLLPTLSQGPWPCAYYLLDSNDELRSLSPKDWTGRCVDESEWIFGYGPLSNSPDQFRMTEWGSQVQALLVRRHFQLTADQLEGIAGSTLQLTVSYDENPRVYLNGTQIWSTTGWNDNSYAVYTLSAADKQLLREGDNVVSVSLQQGGGGGHIDYGLVITEPYDPAVTAIRDVEPAPAADNLPTYDMQGRRVQATAVKAPALIIRGGKKFIVRP